MPTTPEFGPVGDFYLPNYSESSWEDFCFEYETPTPPKDLDDLISNISYLSQIPVTRLVILKSFFLKAGKTYWDQWASEIWPWLLRSAQTLLPRHFPTGVLHHFTTNEHQLSAEAVLALVIHMFLGTTSELPHNLFWTRLLSCWAASNPAAGDETDEELIQLLSPPVESYLAALFDYFVVMKHNLDSGNRSELDRIITYSWSNIPVAGSEADLRLDSSSAWFIDQYNTKMGQDGSKLKPKSLPLAHSIEFSSTARIGTNNVIDVNFANKDISFGKTGTQEEILFGMCPEMHPVVLFSTTMGDTCSISISNARVIGDYSGYNTTMVYEGVIGLKEEGEKIDGILLNSSLVATTTPPPPLSNLLSPLSPAVPVAVTAPFWRSVACIDAMPMWDISEQDEKYPTPDHFRAFWPLRSYWLQFSPPLFFRDLRKATLGFTHAVNTTKAVKGNSNGQGENTDKDGKGLLTIKSGAWGCGAFGGDLHVKFIQQWLATTFLDDQSVKLTWCLFNNAKFQAEAETVMQHCIHLGWSTDDLIQAVEQYSQHVHSFLLTIDPSKEAHVFSEWAKSNTLFSFILTQGIE